MRLMRVRCEAVRQQQVQRSDLSLMASLHGAEVAEVAEVAA